MAASANIEDSDAANGGVIICKLTLFANLVIVLKDICISWCLWCPVGDRIDRLHRLCHRCLPPHPWC